MEEEKKDLTIEELKEKMYKFDDKVIADLKYAFSLDLGVERACRYAKIDKETYYRWLNNSNEFRGVMEEAQDEMFLKSHRAIHEGVENKKTKLETAQWFLERRDKKRFSKQIDQNISVTDVNIVLGNDDKPNDKEPE